MNRVDFILQNMFGKILDVGCEQWKLHQILIKNQDISTLYRVYGLDLKVKKHRESVTKGDAQYMPFKNNTFDTLIAGELIEHVENPDIFLKEARRLLKSEGILILSTPNKNSWVNTIFKSSFREGHNIIFSIHSVKDIVSKYFDIIEFFCLPYDEISSAGSRHKKLFFFRKLIHYFLPQSLQEDMIILGKKN